REAFVVQLPLYFLGLMQFLPLTHSCLPGSHLTKTWQRAWISKWHSAMVANNTVLMMKCQASPVTYRDILQVPVLRYWHLNGFQYLGTGTLMASSTLGRTKQRITLHAHLIAATGDALSISRVIRSRSNVKGTSNNTRFQRFLSWLSGRLQRSCRGESPIGDRFDAWPASVLC